MKSAKVFFLASMIALGNTMMAFAAESWQAAYRDVIDELGKADAYPEPESPAVSWDRVWFYDIDNNGIPEIAYNNTVYTYANGQVSEAGQGWFTNVIPENNTILGQYKQQDMVGEWWSAEFKLENGRITPDYNSIMNTEMLQVPKETLFTYCDFRVQGNYKSMIRGKWVNSDREVWDYIEAHTSEPDTYDAYVLRNDISKPLSAYVTKRLAQARPSNQIVKINGQAVDFQSYLIDGSNYCRLRDIAVILRDTDKKFDVSWRKDTKETEIRTGQVYAGSMSKQSRGVKQAASVYDSIICDGGQCQIQTYNIAGNQYLKLRDILNLVGAEVKWNAAEGVIEITA